MLSPSFHCSLLFHCSSPASISPLSPSSIPLIQIFKDSKRSTLFGYISQKTRNSADPNTGFVGEKGLKLLFFNGVWSLESGELSCGVPTNNPVGFGLPPNFPFSIATFLLDSAWFISSSTRLFQYPSERTTKYCSNMDRNWHLWVPFAVRAMR